MSTLFYITQGNTLINIDEIACIEPSFDEKEYYVFFKHGVMRGSGDLNICKKDYDNIKNIIKINYPLYKYE